MKLLLLTILFASIYSADYTVEYIDVADVKDANKLKMGLLSILNDEKIVVTGASISAMGTDKDGKKIVAILVKIQDEIEIEKVVKLVKDKQTMAVVIKKVETANAK